MSLSKKNIDTETNIQSVTNRIISKIIRKEENQRKALLAKLRNSIGKDLTKNPDILQIIFEHLPEKYLGKTGKLSYEEEAILFTLQMFSLLQQGNSEDTRYQGDDSQYYNLGKSLVILKGLDISKSLEKRIGAMLIASDFSELSYQLRHLIKILKTKANGQAKINYGLLAEDIFWYLMGYKQELAIKWARSYYSLTRKEEKTHE